MSTILKEITSRRATANAQPRKKDKKEGYSWWVLLAIVVAIVVTVGLFLWYFYWRTPATEESSTLQDVANCDYRRTMSEEDIDKMRSACKSR